MRGISWQYEELLRGCPTRGQPGCTMRVVSTFVNYIYTIHITQQFRHLCVSLWPLYVRPANQSTGTKNEARSVTCTMLVTTKILTAPSPSYDKYVFIHVLFSVVAKLDSGTLCLYTCCFLNKFKQNYILMERKPNKPFHCTSFKN